MLSIHMCFFLVLFLFFISFFFLFLLDILLSFIHSFTFCAWSSRLTSSLISFCLLSLVLISIHSADGKQHRPQMDPTHHHHSCDRHPLRSLATSSSYFSFRNHSTSTFRCFSYSSFVTTTTATSMVSFYDYYFSGSTYHFSCCCVGNNMHRRESALNEVAVKPLTHFPDVSSFIDDDHLRVEDQTHPHPSCSLSRSPRLEEARVRGKSTSPGPPSNTSSLNRTSFPSFSSSSTSSSHHMHHQHQPLVVVDSSDSGESFSSPGSSIKSTNIGTKPRIQDQDLLFSCSSSPCPVPDVPTPTPPLPVLCCALCNESLSPSLSCQHQLQPTCLHFQQQSMKKEANTVPNMNMIHATSSEPVIDPKTCPIIPGKETLIELMNRSKVGLGWSIVGGSDTQRVSRILLTWECLRLFYPHVMFNYSWKRPSFNVIDCR